MAAGLLDGQFDVLRVVVDAADDNQVFEAARDEQLAVCRNPRSPVRRNGPSRCFSSGAKGLLGGLHRLPVALRHARAGHPDFADAIGFAGDAGFGIDDHDSWSGRMLPQPTRSAPAGPVPHRAPSGGQAAASKRGPPAVRSVAAGDDQRRLGHSVARIESLAAKAARANASQNRHQGANRSAPLKALPTRRSRVLRCSGVILRTHKS